MGSKDDLTKASIKASAHADYLSGLTCQAVAKKYGVSERTVLRWSARGQWEAERQGVVAQVSADVTQAVTAALTTDATAKVGKHLEIWDALTDKVQSILPMVIKPNDLRDLTSAFKSIVEGQRKALGLDDKQDKTQADQDLDAAIKAAEERESGGATNG